LKTAVIKIGGLVATDPLVLQGLLKEMKAITDYLFVLVHGGGKEVTQFSEKLGIKAEFRDGVRITAPQEMEVVDMVLGGKINIDLVRKANLFGHRAVGLGGSDAHTFVSEVLTVADRPDNRTGKIRLTQPQLLNHLLGGGYLPILHSTSVDTQGQGLNINADEAALEVAAALKAHRLIYISDIPGILKNSQVIAKIDRKQTEKEISDGVISGGMIPKVNSSLDGVDRGIEAVVIGGYKAPGDLALLLNFQSGTAITN